MLKAADLLHVDLLAAAGATGWAVGAQFVPALNNICAWGFAAAFAGVAFTRWVNDIRKRGEGK